MKFHVLRSLIIPWFIFFLSAIAGLVALGLHFRIEPQFHPAAPLALAAGSILCLLLNLATLRKAGIWIAYALPISLRQTSRPWLLRAAMAIAIAVSFYLIGFASWMPMIWQGAVVPAIFTFALFTALWYVLGPLLRWCSTVPFSRTILFVLSIPLFMSVPVTALFLATTVFDAYQASQPNFYLALRPSPLPESSTPSLATMTQESPVEITPAMQKASALRALAEGDKSCVEDSREIQRSLEPSMSEDIAYWATKAVSCSQMKAVVALPKLVGLMQGHSSHKVRAAAIESMPQFGTENVKRVTYLLIKRIGPNEPQEIIEASSTVFSRLPDPDRKMAINKLTSLMENNRTSELAAQILIQKFKQPEVVSQFVRDHLADDSRLRFQAISMICLLPQSERLSIEAHLPLIVSSIQTANAEDPAVKAIDCLGTAGRQALNKELEQPNELDRKTAAQAMSTLNLSQDPVILKTVAECARDQDPTVRKWCGQSLGRIGKSALPEIIDLLKSNRSELKSSGRMALESFQDEKAKDDLKRLRADHSGWLANQRKIQVARAIDSALNRMERETAPPSSTKTEE